MPQMAIRTKSQVKRIALDEASRRMKEFVFVDARSATALARNPMQVPGAIHVPIKKLAEGLKQLPRHRAIVTYCT
jgi:rhodanese-related sulfurtransferase